jgi:hypothetical protein
MLRTDRLYFGFVGLLLGPALGAQEAAKPPAKPTTIRFEIAIEDSSVEPPVHETDAIFLGSEAVRLDSLVDDSGSASMSVIYRRKQKDYLILFHEVEEAVVYDLEEFGRFTDKKKALQERLWERLSSTGSPEEAEVLSKMRESRREAGRLQIQAERLGLRLEKTDETGQTDGHPWTKYREFRSGSLAREFLVTPWQHLGIGAETSEVFEEIAFFAERRKEISEGLDRAPDPFQHFDAFGGFPLVVRQFNGEGEVVFESTVTAIETLEDSDAVFKNPGYAEEGLADRVRELE